MSGPSICFFGESHVDAVRDALDADGPTAHRALNLSHVAGTLDGEVFSHPHLMQALPPPGSGWVFASMLGGNIHTIVGLVQHPQPFDIVLPDEPDLPVQPGAELLPFDYAVAALRPHFNHCLGLLDAARKVMRGPMVHLESPAPVSDDGYIHRNLDGYFAAHLRERPLAPPLLRYKLWRLASGIMRDACRERLIGFMPAPAASLIDGRYLRPEFYGNATHANRAYGALLVRQMEDMRL